MARVTVEDCLEHVDNRFELALEQLCAVVMAKRVEVLRQSDEQQALLSNLLA